MMRNRQPVFLAVFVLLLALPAHAATYAVRAGGGGDFTTIQACLSAAVAGDTCEVYAGTYGAVTSVRAGTGNDATGRIVIRSHAGDRPIVASFSITHSYITVSGFEVTNTSGIGISVYYGVGVIVEDNYVHTEYGTCIQFGSNASNVPTHYVIRNNTVTRCGWRSLLSRGSTAWGISSYGNYSLIDGNDISHVTDDAINFGGNWSVIRNNNMHDMDATETGVQSPAHMDGIHSGSLPIREVLIEGNRFTNAKDPTGNSHLLIMQGTRPNHAYHIVRYNYTYNIETNSGPTYGLGAYTGDYMVVYNNTFTLGFSPYGGHCSYARGWSYTRTKNNICYNTGTGRVYWPLDFADGSNHESGGNLPFHTGYAGAWSGLIASESTYATLRNRDPLFANYPTDGSLQPGSPARNAGVALTTVAAGDSGSGTSLILTDASYFQAGLGPSYARVDADQIRIGASTYATIASISYATNTVTLAAPVARRSGDPVYLFKKSDGVQVLYGNQPDVGAYPGTTPAPAGALRIIR
jgi:hypothetical protein